LFQSTPPRGGRLSSHNSLNLKLLFSLFRELLIFQFVTYAIVEKNLYYLLLFKLLSPVRTQSAVNVLQKPAISGQNDELAVCKLEVRTRFSNN